MACTIFMKGYAGLRAAQAALPETVPVGNPGNRTDAPGYGAAAFWPRRGG